MFDRNFGPDTPLRRTRRIEKLFGDLRVRPKLMVLHNLFFLVLTCSVYFSVIPLVESRIMAARDREISLVKQMFLDGRRMPLLPNEFYQYREGSAEELQIPDSLRGRLDASPGRIIQTPNRPNWLYLKQADTETYRRLQLPSGFYDDAIAMAKIVLLLALGVIYVLAVLSLELIIMPRYVYVPLRLFLEADEASRLGDREHESIPSHLIFDDEIGQIMRSRNTTVSELRRHEADLEVALNRLEETAEDLRQKNTQLEIAKRNLESQDRLVSLGILSASVAHEMNTPLAVLHGSIEKLLESNPEPQTRERLERMIRVSERLRKISAGLLDFSRVRQQEMAPVAVNSLIEESWALVAIDEKAAVVRYRNCTRDNHIVLGNADRLVQVFVNLLRNALNAIRAGGSVVVQSQQEMVAGLPMVSITVDDDGPGIPGDVLPGLFEAFVTTRLDARGTGLGLAVAEGIVHQHDGVIRAENRATGGARLTVQLHAPLPEAQRSVEEGETGKP